MTDKKTFDAAIDAALSACDARIAQLDQRRRASNDRRRALVAPEYKTVIAEPRELHHEIALGSVLRRERLHAGDADALAGALSLDAQEFAARFTETTVRNAGHAGLVFATFLYENEAEFVARGRARAYMRRFRDYHAEYKEWLRRDEAFRLEGAWRREAMTESQGWLIRMTCALTGLALPEGLDRGRAHDWLDRHGANLTYRSFM